MTGEKSTDDGESDLRSHRSAARREWAHEKLNTIVGSESDFPHYHPSWYRSGTVREEAQRTVEAQVEWIREIDNKAMKTLRFNTILLGLIVPAFSFAVRYEIVENISTFYTVHIKAGIGCLIASTAFAGVTYTSSNISAGISSGGIQTAKEHDLTDKGVHDTLIDSYGTWIQSNRKTIFWNGILVTFTILLMISALVFLSLGVTSALTGTLPKSIEYGSYIGLFLVTILSQVL